MTSRDFCYWLRGYIDSPTGEQSLPPAVAEKIRKKLGEVHQYDYVPQYSPYWQPTFTTGGAGSY